MPETTQPARVPLDVDVECREDGFDAPRRYRAVNVGEGGLFVRTARPLPVGTRLRCSFCLPDESEAMEVETEVAWTRSGPADQIPPPGMGLTFLGIAVDDLDRLQLYVDSFQEMDGETVADSASSEPLLDSASSEPLMDAASFDAESVAGGQDKEIIDLVSSPSPVSGPGAVPAPPLVPEMVPPPPKPPADGTWSPQASPRDQSPSLSQGQQAVVDETTSGSQSIGPVEQVSSRQPTSGVPQARSPQAVNPAPGEPVEVILGPVIVEGRVVGLPEGGMEIVGGWSDATILVRLGNGDELTELGLVELGGLGEGRVRMRIDSAHAHLRRGSAQAAGASESGSAPQFETVLSPPPPEPSSPPPGTSGGESRVSESSGQPSDLGSDMGMVSAAMAPEISLSGLEQAPLVPTPAARDIEGGRSATAFGPRAVLRKAMNSKAAVTVVSCLLLVGAGAGVAGLLGGKEKEHRGVVAETAQASRSQGAGQQDERTARLAGSVARNMAGRPEGKGDESGNRVLASSDKRAGGRLLKRTSTSPGLRRPSSQNEGRRRSRHPSPTVASGAGSGVRSASRPGHEAAAARPIVSARSKVSKGGLAVRRRAGKVSVLLGVTGTAKKLNSYWLAQPPGVVVDMSGVRARARPGTHKMSDSQVRFVKVVRRPGGVRFIVYTTSRAAAASARVHSAPGLGVVTWSGKAARAPVSQKLSMR